MSRKVEKTTRERWTEPNVRGRSDESTNSLSFCGVGNNANCILHRGVFFLHNSIVQAVNTRRQTFQLHEPDDLRHQVDTNGMPTARLLRRSMKNVHSALIVFAHDGMGAWANQVVTV
jgi:hypothetical protein